jgi:tetratricopeptide (TPR) repeat protein
MHTSKKDYLTVESKQNARFQQGIAKRSLIVVIAVLFVAVSCLAIALFLTMNAKNNLPEKWTTKGQNFLSAKNYPEAVIAFEEAIKADKKFTLAYTGLADTYESMRDFVKFEATLLDGSKNSEQPAPFYIRLSTYYESQGFYEKAGGILDTGYTATKSADLQAALAKLKPRINFYGNTPGNIIDGGFVARQGDWLYYVNFSDHRYLYKMRLDNTGKKRLNTDKTSGINVIGDWIYYESECTDPEGFPCHTITKIKTDGTNKTSLNDERGNGIYVVNETIYYTDREQHLLKISTAGTGKAAIGAVVTYSFTIYGDWIYYANDADANKLYKIKTDGTMKTKILNDDVGSINVVGDWIYYSSNIGGDAGLATNLNKVKTDGTSRTVLSDQEWTDKINVVGDWIYFSDYYQETMDSYGRWTLYKMKTDGTSKTKLSDENIINVNVGGDWIYYTIRNNTAVNFIDPVLYRMKTDGSVKETVPNPS